MMDLFYKIMLVLLCLTAMFPSDKIDKFTKIENAIWAIVFALLLRLK